MLGTEETSLNRRRRNDWKTSKRQNQQDFSVFNYDPMFAVIDD